MEGLEPYQPPRADLRVDADAARPEVGGRFARLIASFCDGMLMWLLSVVVALAFATRDIADDPKTLLLVAAGANLAFVVIQGALLWTGAATFGKRMTGLVVMSASGRPATPLQLLVLRPLLPALATLAQVLLLLVGESGSQAFGPLGALLSPSGRRMTVLHALVGAVGLVQMLDVLMIFRADRRCLHDLIAGTVVIDRRSLRRAQARQPEAGVTAPRAGSERRGVG